MDPRNVGYVDETNVKARMTINFQVIKKKKR